MKTHEIQTSFMAGVLSPEASARLDADAYKQGLYVGLNIVPRPLGGIRRRPGLRYVATLPNELTRLTGMTITAANGGTTASANDGSTATLLTTTNNVSTTSPYVVVHYDLGTSATVKFADVLSLSSDAGSSTEFAIQYSTDDSTWTTLGDALEQVDTTVRSYRRAADVSARYWRVARIGSTDMGAAKISLGEFNLWTESATVSNARLFNFEVDTETQYLVVLTDRSLAVYEDGVLYALAPSPYESEDLAEVDAAQNQDSLVLVHPDHPPRYVYPEFGTVYSEPISFEAIPEYDFDDADSPTPTAAIQVITLAGTWTAGDTFQVELEGARTAAITFAGDSTSDEQAATAANLAREIQKLYTVPGFTGVTCERTDVSEYTVTFDGASAKEYELMSVVPLVGDGTATVASTQTGVPRTEDAWSATRGYPRTITFFEGRMFFGGTRSLPATIIASKVNQILNLEIEEALDDDAMIVVLNGQRLNAIQALYAGRSLQIFTSGSEMRYAKDPGTPITPRDAPITQTEYGAANIRPVNTDGTTIYVQRTRKAIRDFQYNYEEDAYTSLGISALAPHLINSVVDLAAWNGSSTDEINLVYVVNGDGTLAVLNSRREVNMRAWVQWTTNGEFKAAAGLLEETYFVVEREVNGTTYAFLEVTDPEAYLDCSVTRTGAATDTITGLDHLDGETCRVRADGFVLNDVTPAGGSATLVEGEFGTVEIGLGFEVNATPMPVNQMLQTGPNFMRKRRVTKVRARLYQTLGLRINGRVIPDLSADVDTFDAAPEPFTGIKVIEETTNWDEEKDKIISFTQVDPLPFTLLGLDIAMEGHE